MAVTIKSKKEIELMREAGIILQSKKTAATYVVEN